MALPEASGVNILSLFRLQKMLQRTYTNKPPKPTRIIASNGAAKPEVRMCSTADNEPTRMSSTKSQTNRNTAH